jgi:hypothetical protein
MPGAPLIRNPGILPFFEIARPFDAEYLRQELAADFEEEADRLDGDHELI